MAKAVVKAKAPGIGHNSGASPKSERNRMMLEDKPVATDKQLKSIATLVAEHAGLEAELEALGEAVSNTQEKINKIVNDKLPKAMSEAKTSSFTDGPTGISVKLEKHISAKWPNAIEEPTKNLAALTFLKSEKAEDLLKCLLKAQFGKKEAALAQEFFKDILKTGKATVQFEKGVHGTTLTKWVRERIEAGKKVPMEVFDVSVFTRASVKPPKEKKAKNGE